jgi:hypothetical protein
MHTRYFIVTKRGAENFKVEVQWRRSFMGANTTFHVRAAMYTALLQSQEFGHGNHTLDEITMIQEGNT